MTPIGDAVVGECVTVSGTVAASRNVRLGGRRSMAVVTVEDGTGAISATFFGRGFLANSTFRAGTAVVLWGTVGTYKGPTLKNPEYELLQENEEDLLHTGRIVPVYPLTEGIAQRQLRRWIADVLEDVMPEVEEALPESWRTSRELPSISDAIRHVHLPPDLETAQCARRRLAYDELLGLQLGLLRARAARRDDPSGRAMPVDGSYLAGLRAALPFELTNGQKGAVAEIAADLASPHPMARLLQGDVGAGKTAVALHAVAIATDAGLQTAVMAPTEVLAEQHFREFGRFLTPLGIRVALLTGALRNAADIRADLAAGRIQVVVGTHALFQETTTFHDLGLAIIDEQHRFGVMQRARLVDKGHAVDVLHLSATPIPRTLALTAYGAMDLTIIDELPPGRSPVKTQRYTPAKLPALYKRIHEEAKRGYQTYIVCPSVDEARDQRGLKAAVQHFEELSAGPLAGLRTALIHGRLDAAEKDEVIDRFRAGAVDVLFATTVVEVGIDAPNATTMVIEDAQHFGLTQLHQLRGRVGRGSASSRCVLLGKLSTPEAKERVRILCETNSGFDIAEADLALRGPGEVSGFRQAGLSDFRVADLIRDVRLLDRARRDAQTVLSEDPELMQPRHAGMARLAARHGRPQT